MARGTDHDASAVAIFEMSNGIIYTYRGSWCSEGINTTWESDWRVICADGSVTWNGGDQIHAQAVSETGGFFSTTEDIAVPQPPPLAYPGHAGVIDEFVRCIRTGAKPETICTDNIKSLAMVFRAIESAETGRRVQFK